MYCAMRGYSDPAGIRAGMGSRPDKMAGGKLPVVRSTFMKAEEIDRERERSGWNPYAGEEEEPADDTIAEEDRAPVAGVMAEANKAPEAGMMAEVNRMPAAGMTPEEGRIPDEELQEAERELRKLQSMYPDTAKLLLPYVEEECDKMEYEGSPMFDEYPDRTTVYRVEGRIFEQVKDQFPEEEIREPEEVLAMQLPGARMGVPGRSWARDLARVLLLNEMHHRRRRYHGLRGA